MEFNEANLLILYAQNLSYSRIAKQLNTTRAAISGKIRRIRQKDPTLAPVRAKKEAEQKVVIVKEPKPVKQKPNINTFQTRPRGHREMSKAEMQSMLKRAVENTK